MSLHRNKLYLLLLVACAAGYIWLYYGNPAPVCLIKHTTNIPCPSCGSTRSIVSILQGDFWEALNMNPFGFVIAFIMVLAPFWILFDLFTKKETLLNGYKKIESCLKKPAYAIPLIMLVLMNWIWNITKGL